MSQSDTQQPLTALAGLVGEWTVEAAGPDGKPWPAVGRASIEWLDSGVHVVQRTVTGNREAPDSTSIMGFDGANGRFAQLYSDERGVSRIYDMTLTDRQWYLERVGEPFAQRFVANFEDDGRTIAGRWEKAENGVDYTLDFFLTYRRIAPGS